MGVLIVILAVIILLFGFVVWFGAPYLPTMRLQIDTALDMLDLKPDQTLLELGSGDGRVLRAAAERGINAVGYEINPILVLYSRLATWRYRRHVRVVWANMWQRTWPETDAIYTFLLDRYMPKLDKKITQTYPGKIIKLISFAFQVPNKKPDAEKNGLFLYTYHL